MRQWLVVDTIHVDGMIPWQNGGLAMSLSMSLRAIAYRRLRACGLPADRARAAMKGVNPASVILSAGRLAEEYQIIDEDAFWGNLLTPIMG